MIQHFTRRMRVKIRKAQTANWESVDRWDTYSLQGKLGFTLVGLDSARNVNVLILFNR